MFPAGAFTIIIGTRNGLTRIAPFSMRTPICSSRVVSPPTPPPITTPQRAGSVASSPASLSASAAAPSAS